MQSLTFITGNEAKAKQLSQYLSYRVQHQKLEVHEIQSLNLEEVAIHKAQEAYKIVHSPVMVEDTSLVFNALGSLPGTLVKWFLNALGNDGLARLLHGYNERFATARACFALYDETGVQTFMGEMEGTIALEPKGERGFGWDPIFIPKGYTETWGEMSADTQKETSMRKIALTKLQAYLENTDLPKVLV